jgi:hypothetical protein
MSIIRCTDPHAAADQGYSPNSSGLGAAWEAHQEAAHEETFKGAVLRLRERNGYDDSDFYALVWDEEQQATREIMYATTRGWTYHNGADIDATREVIGKAIAWETEQRFKEAQRRYQETPRKGCTARATERGQVVEGVIAWVGEDKPRSQWAARYGTRTARYGIRVEGRRGLVFRNADAADFEFDVPPVSEEDAAEWRATCAHNARAEFSQALALADKREPLPGPGDVVDAQEADADGWRLYAIGESFCDDEWAQRVAVAVVDEAAEYRVTGVRADGRPMAVREATAFQALRHVSRWADVDGTRIMHDGAGAVLMVREDGGRLVLRPVRAGEGPQEGVSGPVGAEEQREGQEGADGVQGAQEDVTGAEGDPAWVARRDVAWRALGDVLDGGAARYRRAVLVEGSEARGVSDTMPTEAARVYLAGELADGGELSKSGMGVRLVLTRANGARLELYPVRGVA